MIGHKGATTESTGGGGWSVFEVNILKLNFHEINNNVVNKKKFLVIHN